MKQLQAALAAASLLAAAGTVQAQDAGAPEGVLAYPAGFYDAARPNTALGMLARTPGFTLDGGDSVRGLSGAQGNVLIDGRRPTSKSDDLDDIVARIPASQVERIEIVRGQATGLDMQGHPVVANIVRRRSAGMTGAVTVGVERNRGDRYGSELEIEASRSLSGDRLLELSAEVDRFVSDDLGLGSRRLFAPSGQLLDSAIRDGVGDGYEARGTIAWRQPLAGGELALNAGLSGERYQSDLLETPAAGAAERVLDQWDETGLEAGAAFEGPLGANVLRLTALQTLGEETGWSRAESGPDTALYESDERFGETVGRAALSREMLAGRLMLEGGIEGAVNWLEGAARFEENGVPIPLPSSDVRVEERRAEVFASAAWRPSARLSVEAGLKLETSTLSLAGDAAHERDLTYAKPRLQFVLTPDDVSQWRVRLEREVGQLDFGDFVSSSSLDSGVISAGAVDLKPQDAWAAELVYERRFWSEGAIKATLLHQQVADAIDRVLVTGPGYAFDAPGNIGDARRTVLKLEAALPLDRLGWSGGLLKTMVERAHTRVTDPTTGQERRLSGYNPFEAEVELTHSLPARRVKWGVAASFGSPYRQFRFDEVEEELWAPWYSGFVEWSPDAVWTLRAAAENLGDREYRSVRDLYDAPRDGRAPDRIEVRQERSGPYFSLSLRRALGQ